VADLLDLPVLTVAQIAELRAHADAAGVALHPTLYLLLDRIDELTEQIEALTEDLTGYREFAKKQLEIIAEFRRALELRGDLTTTPAVIQ
jgi:hypothetical protein